MLPIVTKYLLQYKKVCIPHVGTFELVQEPPQLDFGNKVFRPPFFTTQYAKEDVPSSHQSGFFGSMALRSGNDFDEFGEKLKNTIRKGPFHWNGFGTLRYAGNGIVFDSQPIEIAGFGSVPAEKVVRENAQHSMLVGDREMTSQQMTEALKQPEQPRPLEMTIGWVVLGLALLGILAWLYLHGFETAAAGLRRR